MQYPQVRLSIALGLVARLVAYHRYEISCYLWMAKQSSQRVYTIRHSSQMNTNGTAGSVRTALPDRVGRKEAQLNWVIPVSPIGYRRIMAGDLRQTILYLQDCQRPSLTQVSVFADTCFRISERLAHRSCQDLIAVFAQGRHRHRAKRPRACPRAESHQPHQEAV